MDLDIAIIAHVREHQDNLCQCHIKVDGYSEDEVLSAAIRLVDSGKLGGKFPPNMNKAEGYDWGYLYSK